MFGFNGECSPQSGFWGLFLFFKLESNDTKNQQHTSGKLVKKETYS
jgi:hypothetical protein